MSGSTRRLSEVARRLVIPAGISTTGWPAVEFWLTKLGLQFDVWQQGVAQVALGKRPDGTYACSVGGVWLSIPRQVGKTFLMSALVFALCLLFPGLTVIWTAHRTKTAAETYRSMRGMCRRRAISPYIDRTPKNNDEWGVFFTNGSRVLFGARESGFGRGFAKVDVLVFDEAQILTDRTVDDMIPAMNASAHPAGGLAFYMGTPPKPDDPAEVFIRSREEALAGEATDMLWVELAPTHPVDPAAWPSGFVDFEAFTQANPSYPLRTSKASILRMVKQLSAESLRREGLGIWDERVTVKSTIPYDAWAALAVREAPDGPAAYGVRFSLDGKAVSVAAAVLDGDLVHGEVVAQLPADDLALDDLPLAQWLHRRFVDCAAIVIDGKSGAGSLVEDLRKLGVVGHRLITPTTDQFITAHAQLLAAIHAGTFSHADQPALNRDVKVATKRPIGTGGGWGWRSIDGSPVTDLDAVTLAAYGAKQRPPAKTPRKVRVM